MAQEAQPGDACIAGEAGYYRRSSLATLADGGNMMFCDGANWQSFLSYSSAGYLGVWDSSPATALDVAGTLKIADGAETCAAGLAGGLRYTSSSIYYCDGTSWLDLGGAAPGSMGSYISKTFNTDHTAAGDGLVIAHGDESGTNCVIDGLTGGTIRATGASPNVNSDTAITFPVQDGIVYRVNENGNCGNLAMWFVELGTGTGGSGATNFLVLNDTPSSFTGEGGKVVQVNAGGTALEFAAAGGGGAGVFELNTGVVRNTGTHVSEDFVFGSTQLADTTNTDHDARIFFDKSKAAFRAGKVYDAKWDNASVGTYSVAMGVSTIASGSGSFAMGSGATASGDNSVAMGETVVASGSYSVAMGGSVSATGTNSIAMGYSSTASGTKSVAMGGSATASGVSSIAMGGYYATASGASSVAMGYYATASGAISVAMGDHTIASGINSIAMGTEAVAGNGTAVSGFGDFSMAIGLGNSSGVTATHPRVTGDSSLGIFLGDQINQDVSTSNVMVLMGGNFGIKNLAPSVELDVTGDIEYTGTIADVSDRRMKTDINDLPEGQLQNILKLQGVSFKMKGDLDASFEHGFIAQDVQPIYPTLVFDHRGDGMLSMNYIGLISPMVEAMKEQNALIEKQGVLIEKLEARVKALEEP